MSEIKRMILLSEQLRNGSERCDFKRQEYANWLKSMETRKNLPMLKDIIFKSDEPLETLKTLEDNIYVDEFCGIFKHFTGLGNIEIYKYMTQNYHFDTLVYRNYFYSLKENKIPSANSITLFRINSLDLLKEFRKDFPDFMDSIIDTILFYNIGNGECDMVDFILANFAIENIFNNNFGCLTFKRDIIEIIIFRLPNLFEKIDNHKIRCDIDTALILIINGFGNKFNPLSLSDNDEIFEKFIYDYRNHLGIEDFIINFNHRGLFFNRDLINFFKILKFIDYFTDHENIINKLTQEGPCKFNIESNQKLNKLIKEIRSNRR